MSCGGKLAEILISEAEFLERIQSSLPFWDPGVPEANPNSNWHSQTQQRGFRMILSTLKNSPGGWSFNAAFQCRLLANRMFHLAWLVFIQVFWFPDLSVQTWAVRLILASLPQGKQWRAAVLVWKPWKRRSVEQISSLFLPSFLSCNNQLKVAQQGCGDDASKPGTQEWILFYWTDRENISLPGVYKHV